MTTIYIGNLNYTSGEDDIRRVFAPYGHVSRIDVATDRTTGKSRGFAFVRMPVFEDAEEAIRRLNGSSFSGRRLIVNEARERESSPAPLAGYTKPHRGILDLLNE